jgi:hypothetical protein
MLPNFYEIPGVSPAIGEPGLNLKAAGCVPLLRELEMEPP